MMKTTLLQIVLHCNLEKANSYQTTFNSSKALLALFSSLLLARTEHRPPLNSLEMVRICGRKDLKSKIPVQSSAVPSPLSPAPPSLVSLGSLFKIPHLRSLIYFHTSELQRCHPCGIHKILAILCAPCASALKNTACHAVIK